MKKTLAAISVGAAIGGLLALVVIVAYAIHNDSGHTGVDPYCGLVVFLPVTIVGVVHIFGARRLGLPRWLGVPAAVVGCAGIALLVYLDQSNTLLQYEVWISNGMP